MVPTGARVRKIPQKADINRTLLAAELAPFTADHPDKEAAGKAASGFRGQTAPALFHSFCFYDLQV